MNSSSDAAESIVRMSLEGYEYALKIVGPAAKEIAAFLYAALKDKKRVAGSTNLRNMIKSGSELKIFSVREKDLKKFQKEAKRYGVLYSVLKKKNQTSKDGIVDIMVKSEDALKINRIVDRFNLTTHDRAEVLNEIAKTKKEKEKGVKEKSSAEKIADDKQNKPINKEAKSVNPHLAKTGKDPLSEPNLERVNTSHKGKKKPSVKKELNDIKKELNKKEKSQNQSINRNNSKPKRRKKKVKAR